jgi:Methyltransferase domain
VLYDSQGYWQGDSGYKDYLAEEKWRRRQARDRAKWFAGLLNGQASPEKPRVLEVGSAAGYFLQELSESGVQAQGLDLSRPMVRLSDRRTAPAVSITQGSVEDAHFPTEHFHGLAAWGCDSNFNDPASTFEKFSQWIRSDGLLTFNFHDYDHWANLIKGRFKLMPNALYFLNRKHVGSLLSKVGFDIVTIKTEFCWMNLASVYHHTGHRWLAPLVQSSAARIPLRLPVPGSFRVLAKKR